MDNGGDRNFKLDSKSRKLGCALSTLQDTGIWLLELAELKKHRSSNNFSNLMRIGVDEK